VTHLHRSETLTTAEVSDNHGHHGHTRDHPAGLRGVITEIFAPHSHDAADSFDDELESSAAGIRAVKISLVVLGITALAQIVVVVLSGSIALAADTIHNFADALTAIPLWIAFALGTGPRRGATPMDSDASRTSRECSWSR
jgi:Co/Zn/Cd efflux system component